MKKIKFDWTKIVAAVLLFTLIIMTVLMYSKITELSSYIAYLQDTTDIILTDMDGLETGIAQTLEAETSLVEDYSIEITDMNFKNKTYNVFVEVIPKEYTDSTKVSVYFGTQECPLEKDGYVYHGAVTLPLDENFDGNLTFLFADGKKKNTEVYTNYVGIRNNLDGVLYGRITQAPKYKDGVIKLSDELEFQLEGFGQYEFESFELVALWDNEEIFCEKVSKLAEPEPEKDLTVGWPEVEADGTEEDTSAAEVLPIQGMSGNGMLELAYEPQEAGELHVFLRAVSTDGYRFVYDLFRCRLAEELEEDTGETKWILEEESFDWTPNYIVYDKRGGSLVLTKDAGSITEE